MGLPEGLHSQTHIVELVSTPVPGSPLLQHDSNISAYTCERMLMMEQQLAPRCYARCGLHRRHHVDIIT